MITKIFSIFDNKVGAYHKPFHALSAREAKRSIIAAAKDPNTLFYQCPGDFTLFCLGEFDDQTGAVKMQTAYDDLGNIISICTETENILTLEQEIERFRIRKEN